MFETSEERSAWLTRRLTFGASPLNDEDRAALVYPTATNSWVPDEFLTDNDLESDRERIPSLVSAWLDHLSRPTTSIEPWLSFFWHDHFAVAAGVVKALDIFSRHLVLLETHALGSFDAMLRDVTTDAAMLVFLDGRTNRAGAINENYGRELLELYALGIGNFDEIDVRSAAVALTGWTLDPDTRDAVFRERRHDDSPQPLLGTTVNDMSTTLDAVTAHPACAHHLVTSLAAGILGTVPPSTVLDVLVEEARDLQIAPVAAALIDAALDGGLSEPIVLSPMHWFLQMQGITGATLEAVPRLFLLRQMGMTPGAPPNVGGYPSQETWAGASTTVGRFRAASAIAAQTPDEAPILAAARRKDWVTVSELAHRPDGFSPTTLEALADANTDRRNGREALAAVLMTPELAVA